jgi:hypothetical protein
MRINWHPDREIMIFARSPILTYRVRESPHRFLSHLQTDRVRNLVVAEGEGRPPDAAILVAADKDRL